MTRLFKILAFFRVIDSYDETLSITSIAMYISLYRLATTPQASYCDIGALLVTLGAHSYKKVINKDNNQDTLKGSNENS